MFIKLLNFEQTGKGRASQTGWREFIKKTWCLDLTAENNILTNFLYAAENITFQSVKK